MTTRGNAKQRVFRDARDRHLFLRLLEQQTHRFGWRCLTYCLMENHYHLLLDTAEPTLGAGMRALNGRYAQDFNLRHRRTGHLWGDRFYSAPLERDSHLLEAVRYIALNPVRAGLCSQPEEWHWSGHRALLGMEKPRLVAVDAALAYFGAYGGDARSRYREFVGGT